CGNSACGAQSERRLLHFATVCLPGSGAARGVVPQLAEAGLVAGIEDFYSLDEASLSSLPNFGPARAASLLSAVAASRRMPPARLLQGLNIRMVGPAAAAALGAAFPAVGQLAGRSAGEIVEASGVGPAVASCVSDWFSQPHNLQLLGR
ncbi:hypothetical protein Agub_g12040, partial [Astrephomene gubernaculifera]